MYNRYVNNNYANDEIISQENEGLPVANNDNSCSSHNNQRQNESIFSELNDTLTSKLQNVHFNLDTLILIIAIYFLLADSEDFDSELLILIGVMFILGF